MTETPSGNHAKKMKAAQTVHVYESAGIAEHEGHVPLWLWLVAVSLLIWGIYYLLTYWNAPVGPS